jgi:hypothetical protein
MKIYRSQTVFIASGCPLIVFSLSAMWPATHGLSADGAGEGGDCCVDGVGGGYVGRDVAALNK